MRLLIIRPEPGASATAGRAKKSGFEPALMPFFEVGPRPWAAPDPANYAALLITSSNAVRHAGAELQSLRALPVHTVGERTADAAREAGLALATVGTSGVDEAVKSAADSGHRRLLWLAGEEHKSPHLPQGIQLDIIVCYSADARPLPGNAAEIIAKADIVALHSPRAARLFADTATKLGLTKSKITIAAFSPAIAEAAGADWRDVAVAKEPTDSALLSAVEELVKLRAVAPSRKEDK
jgi:uroporphyrinogen-III synthase